MLRVAQAAYQKYVARIGREPAPMTVDYRDVVASGHGWVAEQAGRVVAILVLEPAADHLLLENLAVDPDQQGSGIGQELLRLAEQQARLRGLAEVRLYTNVAMIENLAYYSRRGYRETHRNIDDGFHRVFMSKPITG
jgi:ribosomal protein S18 acetylase RimI-like enzyme